MTSLKDVLEYVAVYEIPQFIEPTHGEWFVELIGRHHPAWNEAAADLNEPPLASAMRTE